MAPGNSLRSFRNESIPNSSSYNESSVIVINNSVTAECSQGDVFNSDCPKTEPFEEESFIGDLITNESLRAEPLADESVLAETFNSDSSTRLPFMNSSFTAESFASTLFMNESFIGYFYTDDSFEAERFANNSFLNDSFTQDSDSVSVIIGNNLTLTSRLICSFAIAIACASSFNNSLLLWAIPSVDKSVLKAKYFIQSLTITNLLLPIVFANELLFLTIVASMLDKVSNMCIFGTHSMVVIALFLCQSVCVLSLASDRIYAVALPLAYNTIGYSKNTLIVLLTVPWLVALGICGIFLYEAHITLPPPSVTGEPSICFLILSASLIAESSHVLDSFLICANVACFFVYICLFAVFKYQQRTIHKMSMTNVRKTNVSLVRVYFLLNVTTLVLYLPAPIFSVFQTNAIENDRSVNDIILALFDIYLVNTCLDPIILMSRIPSIRQNLPIKFKPVPLKRAADSQRTESVTT